ncbi:MAG: hypothetical protein LC804_09060 [Acidobacteria bacterium]|nr:hypothetical protein [Acidobacteriota bacterium]
MSRSITPAWRPSAYLAVALMLAIPAPMFAQNPPLAEVARKEQARRKGTKTPAKVYTNKDLPKGAATPPPPASGAPSAPASSATPLPKDPASPPAAPAEQKDEQKDENWWRARITQAREELRRNEMFLDALQSRINGLSADFVNRDDPYQRAKIGEDRQKALAEMDRVKADVEKQKKQIADIEEEARTAGVPPGWLR